MRSQVTESTKSSSVCTLISGECSYDREDVFTSVFLGLSKIPEPQHPSLRKRNLVLKGSKTVSPLEY